MIQFIKNNMPLGIMVILGLATVVSFIGFVFAVLDLFRVNYREIEIKNILKKIVECIIFLILMSIVSSLVGYLANLILNKYGLL